MFYSKWLFNGGRLELPWKLANAVSEEIDNPQDFEASPPKMKKLNNASLLHICDDYKKIVESTSKNLKHRISLRLSGQLIHGICLLYEKNLQNLYDDCYKILYPHSSSYENNSEISVDEDIIDGEDLPRFFEDQLTPIDDNSDEYEIVLDDVPDVEKDTNIVFNSNSSEIVLKNVESVKDNENTVTKFLKKKKKRPYYPHYYYRGREGVRRKKMKRNISKKTQEVLTIPASDQPTEVLINLDTDDNCLPSPETCRTEVAANFESSNLSHDYNIFEKIVKAKVTHSSLSNLVKHNVAESYENAFGDVYDVHSCHGSLVDPIQPDIIEIDENVFEDITEFHGSQTSLVDPILSDIAESDENVFEDNRSHGSLTDPIQPYIAESDDNVFEDNIDPLQPNVEENNEKSFNLVRNSKNITVRNKRTFSNSRESDNIEKDLLENRKSGKTHDTIQIFYEDDIPNIEQLVIITKNSEIYANKVIYSNYRKNEINFDPYNLLERLCKFWLEKEIVYMEEIIAEIPGTWSNARLHSRVFMSLLKLAQYNYINIQKDEGGYIKSIKKGDKVLNILNSGL